MFSFRSVQATRYIVLFLVCAGLMAVFMGGIVYAASHTSTQIWGLVENGSTSMLVRVCGTGPREQIRAENISPGPYWISQIYNYSDPINNSCDPAPGYGGWRLVVGGQPGNQVRIFSLVVDNHLPEADFMAQAHRDNCTVNSLGNVSCTPLSDYPLETYNDANYANTWCYSTGASSDNVAASCNDQISSLILLPGWSVRVYRDANQDPNSPSQCFTASDPNLSDNTYDNGTAINDTISSFVLYQQPSCPSPSNPILQVSPTTLTFNATQGGGNPAAQSFTITNGGTGTLNWTASDDASWLSLSSASGTAPSTVNASINISGLSAGTYNGQITVSSSGATGSPKMIGVTLVVNPAQVLSKVLPVPYVDQVYVQGKPQCFSEGNCLFNHCGPASVAMVFSYYRIVGDVLYDRQPTLDLVSRVKPPGWGASDPGLIKKVLNEEGLQVDPDNRVSFDRIKQNIQNGHPVILNLTINHIVVAIGFEGDNTIIINDPMGGKLWWEAPWIDGNEYFEHRNDRKNNKWRPNNDTTPLTKGQGVRYTYSELPILSGFFITGQASMPQNTQIALNMAQGGTLMSSNWLGQATKLIFSSGSGILQPQDSQILTITHTPQFVPTQQWSSMGYHLASFQVNATASNGQLVQQLNQPFNVIVNLDPSVINNLGDTIGNILTGSDLSTSETQRLDWFLRFAYWDKVQQKWIVIPSTFDKATYQLTAQTNQFAEFAVFVQYSQSVFLPLIIK